jgi:hypothetical protein
MSEGPHIGQDRIVDAHVALFDHLTEQLEEASRDGDDNRVVRIAVLLGALGVLAAAANL